MDKAEHTGSAANSPTHLLDPARPAQRMHAHLRRCGRRLILGQRVLCRLLAGEERPHVEERCAGVAAEHAGTTAVLAGNWQVARPIKEVDHAKHNRLALPQKLEKVHVGRVDELAAVNFLQHA